MNRRKTTADELRALAQSSFIVDDSLPEAPVETPRPAASTSSSEPQQTPALRRERSEFVVQTESDRLAEWLWEMALVYRALPSKRRPAAFTNWLSGLIRYEIAVAREAAEAAAQPETTAPEREPETAREVWWV